MKILWAKTTLLSQTSMSGFSSSNFIVQGGILSTAGCSDKQEENAIKYTKFCCFFLSTTTYQRLYVRRIFAIWLIIFSKKVLFQSKEEISKN
jgi:hypothetical protein